MVSALCHISDNFSQQSPAEQHTGPGHIKISPLHFLVSLAAAMGRSLQRVGGTLQTVGTGLTPLTHTTRQYMCHHSNCGLQPLSTILWLPATSLPGCTAALLHTVNIPYSQFRGKLCFRLQAALALHSAQRTSQHRAVAKINSNKFNI